LSGCLLMQAGDERGSAVDANLLLVLLLVLLILSATRRD
jgi:hypothetical protein